MVWLSDGGKSLRIAYNRFDSMPACNGQTDILRRQSPRYGQHRAVKRRWRKYIYFHNGKDIWHYCSYYAAVILTTYVQLQSYCCWWSLSVTLLLATLTSSNVEQKTNIPSVEARLCYRDVLERLWLRLFFCLLPSRRLSVCLSVFPSVWHIHGFCQNELIYLQTFFTVG